MKEEIKEEKKTVIQRCQVEWGKAGVHVRECVCVTVEQLLLSPAVARLMRY